MSITRTIRPALTLAALALAAACSSEIGTAPPDLTASAPARSLSGVGTVFSVQLRGIPTDPIIPTDPLYGHGHLQIRLGSQIDDACLPPNPVTPQPDFTALSICGRIFNEGGAHYQGGGLYAIGGDGYILLSQFGGAYPLDACRRYEIAGQAIVSDAVAADMIANPTSYRVQFDGSVGSAVTTIGGAFDGTAWGPVGSRPETDPYFATKVCSVAITP